MTDISRIRFNPATKEIEVEGSEEFVKIYFSKIVTLFFGGPDEAGEPPRDPPRVKKAQQPPGKESVERKMTNVETIVALIQGGPEGISTAEIKEKTGVAESQIWNIVNRAAREGRIRKLRRGLYAPV